MCFRLNLTLVFGSRLVSPFLGVKILDIPKIGHESVGPHFKPPKFTSRRNQTICTAAAEVIHVHITRHFTCRLVQRPKGTTIDNKETLFVKKGETNDAGAPEKAVWFSRAVDRLVTAVIVVVVVV